MSEKWARKFAGREICDMGVEVVIGARTYDAEWV